MADPTHGIPVTPTVVAGHPDGQREVHRRLRALNFIHLRDMDKTLRESGDIYYFIYAVDFREKDMVQVMCRELSWASGLGVIKCIVRLDDGDLSNELNLLAHELGTKFIAEGMQRYDDLISFIKRTSISMRNQGSLGYHRANLIEAIKRHDRHEVNQICRALVELGRDNEEVLELLATGAEAIGQFKKVEFYLRQLLRYNPRHLWGATKLAKFYLRNRRVMQALEIMEAMGEVNGLNSERYLEMGTAYVNAGRLKDAALALKKGDELTEGKDQRFKEEMGKVKLAEGDFGQAMAYFVDKQLSPEAISFLNTRAVIATKKGDFEQGIRLYQIALAGTKKDVFLRARINFNLGLAYIRRKDWQKAKVCMQQSVDLGGKRFPRAQLLLEKIDKMLLRPPVSKTATSVPSSPVKVTPKHVTKQPTLSVVPPAAPPSPNTKASLSVEEIEDEISLLSLDGESA